MDGTQTEKKLTPAAFEQQAQAWNAATEEGQEILAEAHKQMAEHMKRRDELIAQAPDFGVTKSYARTLLRRA